MKYLIFYFTLMISAFCFSDILTSRCSLRGKKITAMATEILNQQNHGQLPEAYLNQAELEARFTSEGNKFSGVVEGFYRPDHSEEFSILPSAIVSVKLNRNEHLVYLCAETDEDDAFRIEIYFLGKKGTVPITQPAEILKNIVSKNEIGIAHLELSLFNLGLDGKPTVGKNIIKLLILPYYLKTKIFSGLANLFTNLTGLNVERLIVTDKYLEIAGGINLDHPENPRFSKRIMHADDDVK